MANCFVRWCRSRLLNGYKHIAMMLPEGSEDRASDMEELVQDEYSSDYGPTIGCLEKEEEENDQDSEVSYSKAAQEKKTEIEPEENNGGKANTELKFEEFQCDVSLEGNNQGKDRQEFSFTLYDFNGHGRITKDDIAGLVRTIYDAVGNSVTLPPCGSKTIKVKLTVSPDKTSSGLVNDGEELNNSVKQHNQGKTCNVRTKKDLHVTINEKLLDSENQFPNNIKKEPKINSSAKDFKTAPQCQSCLLAERNSKKFGSVRQQSRQRFAPNHYEDCLGSPMRSRKKYFQRASCFQKQELLAIIRDNMEKNNLNYQHSRKQMNNECNESHKCKTKHWNYNREINDYAEKRNYYLDLAGVDNCYSKFSSTKVYDDINYAKTPQFCRKTNHHRSRSQDHNNECTSQELKYHVLHEKSKLDNHVSEPIERQYRSKSHDPCDYEHVPSPKNPKYLRNKMAQGHSSSPHHLKHKNRERDHQRAMQQVLDWLQKEHIGHKPSSPNGKTPNLVVERHEHHHVHEHVHHHYHHYGTRDPVVV